MAKAISVSAPPSSPPQLGLELFPCADLPLFFFIFDNFYIFVVFDDDFRSAFSIFNSFEEPNSIIWNSIIKSHVDSGLFRHAFMQYR